MGGAYSKRVRLVRSVGSSMKTTADEGMNVIQVKTRAIGRRSLVLL
jgi:hypothetical protein